MKIDKKISIVTACFNEEKKIKKTINSWLKYFKQDLIFKKFEIIITDDGSHDETFNILKKLKKKNTFTTKNFESLLSDFCPV